MKHILRTSTKMNCRVQSIRDSGTIAFSMLVNIITGFLSGKRFFLFILALLCILPSISQKSSGFSYQAMVRDKMGNPMSKKDVVLVFEIIQDTLNGSVIFTESHRLKTNGQGMIHATIGEGIWKNGDFYKIDWEKGAYFLRVVIDGKEIGTTQILAVPYALYAREAGVAGIKIVTNDEFNSLVPKKGTMVFNKDIKNLVIYDGSVWHTLGGSGSDYPTEANAGKDQSIIVAPGVLPKASLQANTPLHGSGMWSIILGEGGGFSNATNPASDFTGNPESEYTLRWTITADDGSSSDDVVIRFLATHLDSAVVDFDGNTYKTVKIGDQVWMAENLKTKHLKNGNSLELYVDSAGWSSSIVPAIRYPFGNVLLENEYGLIYNDYAILDTNLCPAGWRVPSLSDWNILINTLGGPAEAGVKLIETGTSHWPEPNASATNSSQFSALPGGASWMLESFRTYGYYATNQRTDQNWLRTVIISEGYIYSEQSYPNCGSYVRCIRD